MHTFDEVVDQLAIICENVRRYRRLYDMYTDEYIIQDQARMYVEAFISIRKARELLKGKVFITPRTKDDEIKRLIAINLYLGVRERHPNMTILKPVKQLGFIDKMLRAVGL